MPTRQSYIADQPRLTNDRIVVAGGSARTLDVLRLATVRSDDVVLLAAAPSPAWRRFADLFAVELLDRQAAADDLDGAGALLVAIGDVEAENSLVRLARRRGVPVHVADRELVSDFSLLDLIRRELPALAA